MMSGFCFKFGWMMISGIAVTQFSEQPTPLGNGVNDGVLQKMFLGEMVMLQS